MPICKQPTLYLADSHTEVHLLRWTWELCGAKGGRTVEFAIEVDQDYPGRKPRRLVVSGYLAAQILLTLLTENCANGDLKMLSEPAQDDFVQISFYGP